VKLSATPGALVRGAPLLGEHTREVLAEHGYTAHEIETLVASGAVLDGAPGARAAPRGSPP
jgi:crotonobetainyl-CoA:carnitine CoA-transferase CaiB-like acyl-CoA transferase